MTVKTRTVPEAAFQRIASTTADLVQVAAALDKLRSQLQETDPAQAQRLRVEIHRLLDGADAIAEAVIDSTKLAAD